MEIPKLIIGTEYIGLGDHLQFSTIPELAREFGVQAYVSTQNVYRNPEIKKLVWDLNPFIKWTDEAPNIGPYSPAVRNIIADWEIKLFNVQRNRIPKIYYTPKFAKYAAGKIVIDPNAYADPINFQVVIDKFKYLNPVVLNPENGKYDLTSCEVVYTKDIFEWVDMIVASKAFVCQNSGGAVVAAAYHKKADVYLPDHQKANNVFNFDCHYYESI
jgi:hypothetical protein